ncbi:hypothetical protein DMB44_05350 [Thermoplasma sp. Kam2015]|nr:hypothetical protein DMB44_05350 [Thermoplasma sp. Kam2015]
MDEGGYEGISGASWKDVWILRWIHQRRIEKRPINVVFIGQPGSGKSYGALSLAYLVDRNFTVDNVVFSIPEFLKILNSRPPPGTVIVFDEAGQGIDSQEWQSKELILFGKVSETMRYRNLIVFYTVPSLPSITKRSRELIQLVLEATRVRGTFKPFLLSPSPDKNDPRSWFKYPVIVRHYREGIVKEIKKRIVLPMPPAYLSSAYEAKKDAYLTPFYERIEQVAAEYTDTYFDRILEKVSGRGRPKAKAKADSMKSADVGDDIFNRVAEEMDRKESEAIRKAQKSKKNA